MDDEHVSVGVHHHVARPAPSVAFGPLQRCQPSLRASFSYKHSLILFGIWVWRMPGAGGAERYFRPERVLSGWGSGECQEQAEPSGNSGLSEC